MKYHPIEFYNTIKARRLSLGFTQRDLSMLTGISQNAISQYENQFFQPSAASAAALCSALDCTFDDLFHFRGF